MHPSKKGSAVYVDSRSHRAVIEVNEHECFVIRPAALQALGIGDQVVGNLGNAAARMVLNLTRERLVPVSGVSRYLSRDRAIAAAKGLTLTG